MVLSNAQWFANPGVTYEIDESCRFNNDDSAYLYRTPGSSGNRKTWTFSTWLKKCSSQGALLGSGEDHTVNNNYIWIGWHGATNGLSVQCYNTPESFHVQTSALARDPSAWFHVVVAFDTTQSTASNRVKIFINGSQETSLSATTYPSEDEEFQINHTEMQMVGSNYEGPSGGGYYWDGYLAETYLIDGTALTPSSFGETNSTTGQWVPIEVADLTYGTNGFRFSYEDSSAFGDDTSGEGNDYTSSGLAAADQVTDSPTDNFCTLNPLTGNASITYSDGNLSPGRDASSFQTYFGTQALPSTGKWYWEITAIGGDAPIGPGAGWDGTVGIGTKDADDSPQGEATNWVWGNAQTTAAGQKHNGSSINLYPASSLTNNSIVMTAVDMTNSKIWWGVDGSWMGTASGDNDGNPATGANPAFDNLSGELFPLGNRQNDYEIYNFGQQSFAHTPPTGFSALSTANLDDPTIADPSGSFQTTLYTGDGASSLAVNQGGNKTFEPGFVWIKNRDAADGHVLTDAVRGATKVVSSDSTAAETTDADTLTAFDSDGFTVGADVKVNTNTEKYVGWQWKTDGTSGSSNTDGTNITSTVSANTTAGFSVVKYPGSGTASDTVGHGLGVTPELIMVRNLSEVSSWCVTHVSLSTDKVLRLEGNNAEGDIGDGELDSPPNSSSVFGFNNGTSGTPLKVVNESGDDYIAYVAAGVEGFSKFGSYTGNGDADGPFNWCGFRPAWLIIKRTDGTGEWYTMDDQRDTYNNMDHYLRADTTNAEGVDATSISVDFLSNGFKMRYGSSGTNGDGQTFVFIAFADTPFKTALAR
jgi:hypothetical protein